MDVKEIREALQKIEEETWAPTPDDQRYLKIRNMARKAIAELDNPAASDAREVVNTIFKAWADIKGVDDALMTHMAAAIIESFAANRERKAREDTAQKCVEAFRYWMLRGQAGGANRLEAAIMEAAHE
jgi:hypothetical protein